MSPALATGQRRWWRRRPPSIALALLAALLFSRGARAMIGEKDYIDSPFTGQGSPPPGVETTIFMSTYLDRLISVDEKNYIFSVTLYFHLSWTDPRAPLAVANATARMNDKSAVGDGGAGCDRPCSGQEMRHELSLCCDTLWLPSLVFRNILEFPQGRVQPYKITARESGVVTWRVEVRAEVYTSMIFAGFPFDAQTLDLHISMTASPFPNNATLAVKSSATGIKLYTQGDGDDLSSWKVTDLHVYVVEEPWAKQFDDPDGLRNLVQPSDRDDPAPLVPRDARARAALERERSRVLRLTVSIFVARLSLYFALQSILPVALCTLLSLTCFFLGASRVATRLELTFSLFLTLAAIQFVIGEELPKTSAVLPSQVLVLFSYSFLFLVAAESLFVYHVEIFPQLRSQWRRRPAAREAARRELSRAVSSSGRRLAKSISSIGRRRTPSSAWAPSAVVASAGAANDAARRRSAKDGEPLSPSSPGAAAAAASASAAGSASSSSRGPRPLRSIRFSSDAELGTASAAASPGSSRTKSGADDDDRERGRGAGAGPKAAFPTVAPGDHDGGEHHERGLLSSRDLRGDSGGGGGGGGEDGGGGAAARDRRRGTAAAAAALSSSSAAARRGAELDRAAAAAERDRFAFAAWWIDRASFWLLLGGYALAAVLIFSLSEALAPGECAQFAQQSLVDECRLARRAAEARRAGGGERR